MKKLTQFVVLALSLVAASQAATITFTPASVASPIGGVGGFGLLFVNDGSGYAVLDQTTFDQPAGTDGSYTDLIGLQSSLLVVAPNATFQQSFNANALLGAGEYAFGSDVTPGTTVDGTLTLYYDVYSVSPFATNFDAFTDYLSTQQVSGAVTITAFSPAPEPSEYLLFGAGLCFVAFARKGVKPLGPKTNRS